MWGAFLREPNQYLSKDIQGTKKTTKISSKFLDEHVLKVWSSSCGTFFINEDSMLYIYFSTGLTLFLLLLWESHSSIYFAVISLSTFLKITS